MAILVKIRKEKKYLEKIASRKAKEKECSKKGNQIFWIASLIFGGVLFPIFHHYDTFTPNVTGTITLSFLCGFVVSICIEEFFHPRTWKQQALAKEAALLGQQINQIVGAATEEFFESLSKPEMEGSLYTQEDLQKNFADLSKEMQKEGRVKLEFQEV